MKGLVVDKLPLLAYGDARKFAALCKETRDLVIIQRVFVVQQFNLPPDIFVEYMLRYGVHACRLFRDKVEFVAVAHDSASVDQFIDGLMTATVISQA